MKKGLLIENDENIKLVKHKNKLFTGEVKDIVTHIIPVHLIKLVQKAYLGSKGTVSISIFLETDVEFLITCNEADNIDEIFDELLELKKK